MHEEDELTSACASLVSVNCSLMRANEQTSPPREEDEHTAALREEDEQTQRECLAVKGVESECFLCPHAT